MKKSVIFACSCLLCTHICPECKCYKRNSADSGDGQDNPGLPFDLYLKDVNKPDRNDSPVFEEVAVSTNVRR